MKTIYLILALVAYCSLNADAQNRIEQLINSSSQGTAQYLGYMGSHNQSAINQANNQLRTIDSEIDQLMANAPADDASFKRAEGKIIAELKQQNDLFVSGHPNNADIQANNEQIVRMMTKYQNFLNKRQGGTGGSSNNGVGGNNTGFAANNPAAQNINNMFSSLAGLLGPKKSADGTPAPNVEALDVLKKGKELENTYGNTKVSLTNTTGSDASQVKSAVGKGTTDELSFDNIKTNDPTELTNDTKIIDNANLAIKHATDLQIQSGDQEEKRKEDMAIVMPLVKDKACAEKLADFFTQNESTDPSLTSEEVKKNIGQFYPDAPSGPVSNTQGMKVGERNTDGTYVLPPITGKSVLITDMEKSTMTDKEFDALLAKDAEERKAAKKTQAFDENMNTVKSPDQHNGTNNAGKGATQDKDLYVESLQSTPDNINRAGSIALISTRIPNQFIGAHVIQQLEITKKKMFDSLSIFNGAVEKSNVGTDDNN